MLVFLELIEAQLVSVWQTASLSVSLFDWLSD